MLFLIGRFAPWTAHWNRKYISTSYKTSLTCSHLKRNSKLNLLNVKNYLEEPTALQKQWSMFVQINYKRRNYIVAFLIQIIWRQIQNYFFLTKIGNIKFSLKVWKLSKFHFMHIGSVKVYLNYNKKKVPT